MADTLSPTREAGLARLHDFLPCTGRAYAAERNFDRGPGAHRSVSMLSPYLRHRLVLEREVLEQVRARYAPSTADKFISEVYWRSYFKGYLERRPSIWRSYRRDITAQQELMEGDAPLSSNVAAAERGATGIDAFDHWAQELVETGYLHNHARMWFASIWIFTLHLPWVLGADFFLRHLLDGDPASNTLSWRWVAGLHTKGRTYLARKDNIARYTEGRFAPAGLAPAAPPLIEDETHPLRPVPTGDPVPAGATLWLVTEEDCAAETVITRAAAVTAGDVAGGRSPLPVAPDVLAFTAGAVADGAARLGKATGQDATRTALSGEALVQAAEAAGVTAIATLYPPVGPAADALGEAEATLAQAGISLHRVLRAEDPPVWQKADGGFFKVRKAIPSLLPA